MAASVSEGEVDEGRDRVEGERKGGAAAAIAAVRDPVIDR